ncbi:MULTISPECIES: glycosyltransferase family 2 protein [Niastella]|uniref:Glycosyltransferase family 2 protein n=1 Tax=Niastella soli TaxID=2821487 RepID=A0ABS3YPW1_9BACT|nr:glycosyltransferase family 2 protein [Niastella soli]MBO9199937.1 glycosyltransferase family 2 protein [Niastella soli]
MNSITAVIITHNEARNIQRCLASLRSVADEIIVVDSFSTDDTVTICKQEGAIVIQQSWLGFGPQKNVGIQKASHEYILSLDADEALDEELQKSILAAKNEGLQDMYEFTRSNFYYGKFLRHGLEYPDFKIRLFPKSKVRWNDELVHETLQIAPGLSLKRLKGHLLHYTYYLIEEHVAKANKYTTLGAELNFKRGKKASWFKILFSPLATFVQAYIIKGGFLDGGHGFILAVFHAYGAFMKYTKLWQLNNEKK